jgi:putative two-component system response regulator
MVLPADRIALFLDRLEEERIMARVLIVDDAKNIRSTVQSFLADQGYQVDVAEDAGLALKLLAEADYDVVVSDIILPKYSGITLIEKIHEAAPDAQVILMTGEPTVEMAVAAVRAGGRDYLTKPVSKNAILRSVGHAAQIKKIEDEKRRLEIANRAYQSSLERLVRARTNELELALAELSQTIEGVFRAMEITVESRDPYTAGHQRRVAKLSRAIGAEMDLTEERLKAIRYSALIHDLGKIAVPSEILSKPSRLTENEMNLVKSHPRVAFDILKGIHFLWPIADIVLQHHERLNGSGYPQGLKDNEIIIEARILSVADVVEAMTSHRPYRPALGLDKALAEITENQGKLYDQSVVQACLRVFRNKAFHFDEAVPEGPISLH